MTKTISMRVTPHEDEQIRIAAAAANLSVASYVYRRVTDTPILSTPALAALAELVSALRGLENAGSADLDLLEELRTHVAALCRSPLELVR